jgi:hypothetical protein
MGGMQYMGGNSLGGFQYSGSHSSLGFGSSFGGFSQSGVNSRALTGAYASTGAYTSSSPSIVTQSTNLRQQSVVNPLNGGIIQSTVVLPSSTTTTYTSNSPLTITNAYFSGTYTLSLTGYNVPSITATITNNQISLQGCNKISLTFSVESDGDFKARDPVTLTRMTCLTTNDNLFTNAILNANKFVRINGGFQLCQGGVTVATFTTISTVQSVSSMSSSPNKNSMSSFTSSIMQSPGSYGVSSSVSSSSYSSH